MCHKYVHILASIWVVLYFCIIVSVLCLFAIFRYALRFKNIYCKILTQKSRCYETGKQVCCFWFRKLLLLQCFKFSSIKNNNCTWRPCFFLGNIMPKWDTFVENITYLIQLPMQSVPITTDVVSSNLDRGEVFNIMW
jgi:hypothetical protein